MFWEYCFPPVSISEEGMLTCAGNKDEAGRAHDQ